MQATLFEAAPINIAVKNYVQNLQSLIYGNGGHMPATIKFWEDGGHGWLQVPHNLLKKLKIQGSISSYSYRDDVFAYLEEDSDLSIFMRSINVQPSSDDNRKFWNTCPKEYHEESPVRRKKSY